MGVVRKTPPPTQNGESQCKWDQNTQVYGVKKASTNESSVEGTTPEFAVTF